MADVQVASTTTTPGWSVLDRHEGHHNHGWNAAEAALLTANQNSVNTQGIIGEVNRNGLENVNATERVGLHADSTAQRFGLDNSARIERFGIDNHNVTERFGLHLDKELDHGFSRTNDNMFLKFQDTNVSMLKEFEKSNLRVADSTAAIQLEATKNAAASALAAATNTAAIQAAMAACCCEIKERIGDDGQKTRDLVNAIQNADLATQLQDAKSAILALQVRFGTVATVGTTI